MSLQRIQIETYADIMCSTHIYSVKEKSRNMNLKFKSSEPDLKFNIQSQLKIINGNIMYLTREVDKITRLVQTLSVDTKLQHTVDKYFDEDNETDIPEDGAEPKQDAN